MNHDTTACVPESNHMLRTLGNSNGVPEQCTALYGSSHWESGIHDICSEYMYVQSAVQHAGLSIVLGVTKHEVGET